MLETVDALAAFFNKLIVISICTELSYLLHKHHKLIHFAVIGVNAEQRTFFIPHFFSIVAFSFRLVGVTVFRRSYDLVYRAFILSLSVLHSAKSVLIILPSLMTIHGRELFGVFIFSSLFVAG